MQSMGKLSQKMVYNIICHFSDSYALFGYRAKLSINNVYK